MNTGRAHEVIVASLLATGTLGALHELSLGHAPSLRQGLGLTVAGIMLALLAGPAPTVAGGFAVLLLVSALFSVGDATLTDIRKALA